MKSLLESIFGGRESIINTSKASLWKGYDKLSPTISNRPVYPHAWITWTPSNKDNILKLIYPDGDIYTLTFFLKNDVRAEIEMLLEITADGQKKSLNICIYIDPRTFDNNIDSLEIIKKTFKLHPDIFKNIFDCSIPGAQRKAFAWDYFKKIYIDK